MMYLFHARLYLKVQTLAAAGLLFIVFSSAHAATWYVDNAATGANNGTSWANAWTSLSSSSGTSVASGDTVYISGGPSGSSQTYSIGSGWSPKAGSSSGRITYQIGQDALHNGTAIFSLSSESGFIATGTPSYLNIIGDAGDGARHFQVNNCATVFSSSPNFTDCRLAYVNFGTMNGAADSMKIAAVNHFEMDHNYLNQAYNNADALLNIWFSGSTYTDNLIHDNVMLSASTQTIGGAAAYGADGMQMNGSGYSIYNNTEISYASPSWNPSEGQHSDGYQTGGGNYIAFYNNYIFGYIDIGFYGGCWGNAVPGGSHSFQHVRIYNNIIDNNRWQAVGSIEIEADDQSGSTFNDIIIANNLLRVNPGAQGECLFFGSSSSTGGTWTANYASNNICIGNYIQSVNCTFPEGKNPNYTDAQVSGLFKSFTAGSTNNDYRLAAGASAIIGQAVNLSSVFTTDKNGNSRQSPSANWDIGPYVYGSTNNNTGSGGSANTNPVIAVSQTSLNFGSIPTNTAKTLTFTVQNTGNGILAGAVTTLSGAFTVLNGVYVLTAGQSQTVTVQFRPTALGSVSSLVTFLTGGLTGTFSGTGTTTPPPAVSSVSSTGSDVDPNLAGLQIYAGSVIAFSASASDPNGYPLTWQWIYTVNGGSENVYTNGTGAVRGISFNYSANTANSTYVWKLRVSNGFATTESDLTVGVETPPVATSSLTFQAGSGIISGLFVVTNGYIYQPVATGATNGGSAIYNFAITNAGNYVVQASVNAPNAAANSMYVNIDAQPQDPGMIWDIPMTSGFEQRIVAWRGNGTDGSDQFVPQIFNLSAGLHQIIIVGREAGVELQSFSILPMSQPPTGVRVIGSSPN